MKLKYIIVSLLCIFASTWVNAQSLSNAKRRALNQSLLTLIEEYEVSATLYDEEKEYIFKSLFESEQSPIFCDLMGANMSKNMTVSEYVEALSNKYNVNVIIKRVTRDDYQFKDGKWRVNLKFDKEVEYSDENGVLFSSSHLFKSDYNLVVSCVYEEFVDETTKEKNSYFVIDSIAGNMTSSAPLLAEKFWVVNKNDVAAQVLGYEPDYNKYNQAFAKPVSLKPWNENVIIGSDIVASTSQYDLLNLYYSTVNWRVLPRISFALNNAYKVGGRVAADEAVKSKNSAFEIGADVGYTFPIKHNITLGVYSGLALSTSSLSFGGVLATPLSYVYETTAERSKVRYDRRYTINAMSESVKYVDIAMPLYAGVDFRINNKFVVSPSLGLKCLFNVSNSLSTFHVEGTVVSEGYEGDGTINDELGDLNKDYSSFLMPSRYARKSVDTSLLVGLMGQYSINELMNAYAKFSFEYGFDYIHKGNNDIMFDVENKVLPIVYASRLGNIATQSYMNVVNYRRSVLWFELGVNYKF